MEILFREFSVQGVLLFLSNTYGGVNVWEAELSQGNVLQCSCNGGLTKGSIVLLRSPPPYIIQWVLVASGKGILP